MRDPRLVSYRLRLKSPSRELRRNQTPAERRLWYEFLRNQPEKFTRQKPLGAYIAAFYCSARRLVIEIDGDSHFNATAACYDGRRTAMMEALGLRIVRFTNAEVMQQFE